MENIHLKKKEKGKARHAFNTKGVLQRRRNWGIVGPTTEKKTVRYHTVAKTQRRFSSVDNFKL